MRGEYTKYISLLDLVFILLNTIVFLHNLLSKGCGWKNKYHKISMHDKTGNEWNKDGYCLYDGKS